ncbi:hypothetical protein [Geomonas sp.]|uniref:hypothetical protein n=1 Tax=Geomonas sp. TaxID=2651584 RepID=UPI002B48EF47|nr:hypothetical protein [Geomonas sp.]HJV33580.1 hypothetical protein [Geomonas sp.]
MFNLQIAQYADCQVKVGPAPETQQVGRRFMIPVEIVNTGNGSDSFQLESGFPREYDFHFAAAAAPDIPIKATPPLAVGEKFQAVAVGTIPRSNLDGQKNIFAIKVISAFAGDTSQSRELIQISSAPLLRAVASSDKPHLLPGEKISYRITLLNIGSAAAPGVTLKVNYPPQYELVGFLPSGSKYENQATLVLDDLPMKSEDSKDFDFTFQVKDEALAGQELFLRMEVINRELDKTESFVSPSSVVTRVSGAVARTVAEKLVVVPGEVVSLPIVVTNTGNGRESLGIRVNAPAGVTCTIYNDLNHDGKRQGGEAVIERLGPLSPKEDAHLILEIKTSASAKDGTAAPVSVAFLPESGDQKNIAVNLQLAYSRPIIELTVAAKDGRLKPGEVSSLELNCVNRGSKSARQVTVQSFLPVQLELIAADPSFAKASNGVYTWRFEELGKGEQRNIKVTYRVKAGIAVGTSMQLRNLLNYQDQLGNRY